MIKNANDQEANWDSKIFRKISGILHCIGLRNRTEKLNMNRIVV